MKNRVQRQLIYRVMWNDEALSVNIVPLSVTRHLSIWQFSHDSWRGASLQGRSVGVKNTMLTLSTLIGRNTDAIRGLVHRNMGRGLIGWLIKASHAVLFHCKPSTVRQIGHFCSRLRHLMVTQGEKGATLYLKSCQVLLQQSVAGYKVQDLTELKSRVSRTRAGMPRIIPAGVRKRIRQGDLQSLRLWMTLLGFYRVLEFRGKLNLSTITDPGVDIPISLQKDWTSFLSDIFFPTLKQVFTPSQKVELHQPNPFPILKSGPQTVEDVVLGRGTVSTSFYSLVRSAKAWQTVPLKGSLKELLDLWSRHSLGGIFPPIMERIGWAASNNWHYQGSKMKVPDMRLQEGVAQNLAKLGFKEEAAGKVRVFAMVDPFTQWVMKPLHECIFTILRGIPMDGTFNQTKPVELLRSLPVLGRWFFSIDLSAATDRLPVSMQVPVMEQVFRWVDFPSPSRAAQLWAELLVGRAYRVALPPAKERGFDIPDDLPESVTYAVGQPMGALSSWAMLALTHHAIVHWAAHRARRNYPNAIIPIAFTEYAVLGDDIVIANRFVAREYTRILDWIGVKAGLAKSIVSRGQFYVEFAKKFFVPSARADMLPFKEVIATLSSTLLICEFVKQHNLTIQSILTILGYGYRTKSRATMALFSDLGTRLRTLLIWMRSPKGAYPLTVPEWIRASGFNTRWDVSDDHPAWEYIWQMLMEEVQLLMNRYYDASEKFRHQAKTAGALRPSESMLEKGIPISRHPPVLMEKLVRDDTINQFVTEPVPFSALIAPIDYDLYGSTGITDASEFNRKYGVTDEIPSYEIEMPKSLIEADLFEMVFAINDENLTDKKFSTKCEELVSWIFNDFDRIAQDIPTDYWPQLRAAEKPMREFIQVAKYHEIFSRVFGAFRLDPRQKADSAKADSGNTPVELAQGDGKWDCWEDYSELQIHRELHRVGPRVLFSLSFFSHQYSVDWWGKLTNLNKWVIGWVLMATAVWLVPLYPGPEMAPTDPTAPIFLWVAGVLLAALVITSLTAYYYYRLGVDFEYQSIDLLSQQAQRISELEVRLIRMQAENMELDSIIEGLEQLHAVTSSTL